MRRFVRFADALPYPSSQQYFIYRSLFGPSDLQRLLTPDFLSDIDAFAPQQCFTSLYESGDFPDELARVQHHDLMTYLPDDLLVKADIASMAASLELRAPMLDHRLVELGLSLPAKMKVSWRKGKRILRLAFAGIVPDDVFDAPKRGFAVPLGGWLRNELRAMLMDALFGGPLLEQGICRPEALAGLMNDHLTGRDDHRHRLWALLVLSRWLQMQ